MESIIIGILLVVSIVLAVIVGRLFSMTIDLRKAAKQESTRAVSTSRAVIRGQVAEQLFPIAIENPHDPGDMKFLGQPVDYIVFDGMNAVNQEITVYFLEIKTGKSQLSPKQRAIKEAVEKGRVIWHTVRIKGITDD